MTFQSRNTILFHIFVDDKLILRYYNGSFISIWRIWQYPPYFKVVSWALKHFIIADQMCLPTHYSALF